VDEYKILKLPVNYEKPITVIISSYNNKIWHKKNLRALFNQNYENYKVIYIDDCSTDGTGDLVKNYIKESGYEKKIRLVRNHERKGALYNLYSSQFKKPLDRDNFISSALLQIFEN